MIIESRLVDGAWSSYRLQRIACVISFGDQVWDKIASSSEEAVRVSSYGGQVAELRGQQERAVPTQLVLGFKWGWTVSDFWFDPFYQDLWFHNRMEVNIMRHDRDIISRPSRYSFLHGEEYSPVANMCLIGSQ